MAETVDETLADMIAAGAFGPDSRLVSFGPEGRHTEHDQFASCVLYGTATVDHRDGRRRSHRLVFKFKHPTAMMRDLYKNDQQFHNEILFYERIAPFLLAGGPWPATPSICRYFYGRNDCGDPVHRDVIVLENESVRGYRPAVTEHRLCLDFDHLTVALGTLAKFHGLSYRAKHKDLVKFTETVAGVKETHWSEDGEWLLDIIVLQGLVSTVANHLNERYAGCVNADSEVKWMNRFQSELLADAKKALKRVMEPVEPLSVLCHGDFNRNNLLFRYDDGGRPVDALAYDVATVRYGSPALDLSFFLYMNTDRQTRDEHWDALLDGYCETLAAAAGDVPVPGRDQLDAEIREHGFYGLVHVSYFARFMLDEFQKPDMDEFFKLNPSEVLEWFLSHGGDPANEWISDAFQHFLRYKFHGLSYTAKHKSTTCLRNIVVNIVDCVFDENGQWKFKSNAISKFGKRGVDRLLKRSGDLYRDSEHLRRFNALIGDGICSLRRTMVPREPFAVVCHGDFNRNNLLFWYDEAGFPVDALLFDFGTPQYGSPALDLSFFLYMNSTQMLRDSRWDDMLNAYCSTLAKAVPSGVRVPNRAELDSEMAACAFFGLVHASFFLPHQLESNTHLDEVLDDDEMVEWLLKLGGDVGTDFVADMVQHLVDMEFTSV